MKNVGNNSRGRSQRVPKIFTAPMYRAHCAVIFAIAQLSCTHKTFTLYGCVYFYHISDGDQQGRSHEFATGDKTSPPRGVQGQNPCWVWGGSGLQLIAVPIMLISISVGCNWI